MGDQLIRIVVERQGAAVLPQTRADVMGLTQAQTQLTVSTQGQRAALTRLGTATSTFSGQAARGVGSTQLLRSALTQLAFQATGTAGPVGRLASGLLLFGGGSALVIGVAAGLAGIGLAIRVLGREARESEDRIRTMREETEKLRDVRLPGRAEQRGLAATTAATDAALARIRTENERLNVLARDRVNLAATLGVTLTPTVARQRLLAEGQGRALQRAIAEVTGGRALSAEQSAALQQTLNDAGQSAADEWLRGMREQILNAGPAELGRIIEDLFGRITDEASRRRIGPLLQQALESPLAGQALGGLPPGFFIPPPGVQVRPPIQPQPPGVQVRPPIQPQPPGVQVRPPIFFVQPQFLGGVPSQERIPPPGVRLSFPREVLSAADPLARSLRFVGLGFTEAAETSLKASLALDKVGKSMTTATKGADILGVHLISAISGAIGALVSGGSAGGFLGGLGGILGLLGPQFALPAALIGGVGTVVSGFESRGVRVDSYGDTALRQMREANDRPDLVNLVVTGAPSAGMLRRLEYDLGRRTRLDRTERLPPGSTLGG